MSKISLIGRVASQIVNDVERASKNNEKRNDTQVTEETSEKLYESEEMQKPSKELTNKYGLVINDNCIQCGACLGLEYDFLTDMDDGSVSVKPGTYVDEDIVDILMKVCPVEAFERGEIWNKKKVLIELRQALTNVKGCLPPDANNFPFDKNEYKIALPASSGRSAYEYSSEEAAERAAMAEFKDKMYYQIDKFILKVITEYRVNYVKPYYTKEVAEGSVYAKVNAEVNSIIESIVKIFDSETLEGFTEIEVYPDADIAWKLLNNGELLSDEMVSVVKNKFSYTADMYSGKWTTDYIERPAGKDFWGNYKTKELYCYKNVIAAYIEFAKDLEDSLRYAKDDLEKRAVEVTSWLVEAYNKKLREELEKRIKILDDILVKMDKDISDEDIVSLESYEYQTRRVTYKAEKKCLVLNGNEMEDTECYIAGDDEQQIFFDGTSLYKKYVDKSYNAIMKDLLFSGSRFDKSLLIGKGNTIVIWDNNDDVYTYHVKEGTKHLLAKDARTVCRAGDKVVYSKWNYNDRFTSKYLYVCDLNGKNTRMIDSVPYSRDILLYGNVREDDNKLKFEITNIMHRERSVEKEIDLAKI